jgi:hypothetical protein
MDAVKKLVITAQHVRYSSICGLTHHSDDFAHLLGKVQCPAPVVNEAQLTAGGREPCVCVVAAQQQPELRAAGQHSVRLPQILRRSM